VFAILNDIFFNSDIFKAQMKPNQLSAITKVRIFYDISFPKRSENQ